MATTPRVPVEFVERRRSRGSRWAHSSVFAAQASASARRSAIAAGGGWRAPRFGTSKIAAASRVHAIMSTDVLEHLPAALVPLMLAEFSRVATERLFLAIAVTPEVNLFGGVVSTRPSRRPCGGGPSSSRRAFGAAIRRRRCCAAAGGVPTITQSGWCATARRKWRTRMGARWSFS